MVIVKSGDVLLFRWNSPYSKLIYLANYINHGRKGYSHVGVVAKVNKYSIIVYEALSDGFKKIEYGKSELDNLMYNNNVDVGRVNIKLNNVKNNCEKYLGRPYGWMDILSIGFYTIFRKYSFLFSPNAQHLICSEAVARILYDSSDKKINMSDEFNKHYSYITPTDIHDSKHIKIVEGIE